MKDIKNILIVCTGNSCRSIMAEGYLVKRLKDEGKDGIKVLSAGTGAFSGLTPTVETVQVMKECGIDVSGYVSSALNEQQIKGADAILAMATGHKDRIVSMVPEAKDKVFLLKEFLPKKSESTPDIEDPIGKSVEFYRETLTIIKDSIEGFLKRLED